MHILSSEAAVMDPGPLTERLCIEKRIFPPEAYVLKNVSVRARLNRYIILF